MAVVFSPLIFPSRSSAYFLPPRGIHRLCRQEDYAARGGSLFAWDADNIFYPCHAEGQNAFRDPHGLVYCAEAEWDFILLEDPVGYALYVGVLEVLVERRLTPAVFDEALADTGEALLNLLERASSKN